MFHHEHSATVGVVCIHSATIFLLGVVPVIREFSACGSRFALLLFALFFAVVAEFSVVVEIRADVQKWGGTAGVLNRGEARRKA